jgi:hypothetical protein
VLTTAGACAPPPPAGPPIPQAEGEAIVAALAQSARLRDTAQIRFDWSVSEQGARADGTGVARVQAPASARLDLFLRNGTTVAVGTLLDGELRVAGEAPAEAIPPPDLMWAALGVFRPGREATLQGARYLEGGTELRYAAGPGQELRYLVEGERIVRVELYEGGHAVHRMELAPPQQDGYPTEARYRNLSARRELTLTTRSVTHVDAFPPDIWSPIP